VIAPEYVPAEVAVTTQVKIVEIPLTTGPVVALQELLAPVKLHVGVPVGALEP
jgi:hypothetical protein